MFQAALILAAWLALVPIGLVLLGAAAIRRRQPELWCGLVCLLVSLPAVFFSSFFWPFDWIIPGAGARIEVRSGAGTLTWECMPTSDFYTTEFRVTGPGYEQDHLHIDYDGPKYWFPRTVDRGSRIYFVSGLGFIDEDTPFLDRATGRLGGVASYISMPEAFDLLIDPTFPASAP